jgi:hypothetical protein
MVQSCFLLRGGQETNQKVPPLPSGGVINPVLALVPLISMEVILYRGYYPRNLTHIAVLQSMDDC